MNTFIGRQNHLRIGYKIPIMGWFKYVKIQKSGLALKTETIYYAGYYPYSTRGLHIGCFNSIAHKRFLEL